MGKFAHSEEEETLDSLTAQGQLAELRKHLGEAEGLGNLTGDAFRLHYTQLINSLHGQMVRADEEVGRLKREIENWKGRSRGAEQTIKLILATLKAHNSTVRKDAEDRAEEERREKEEEEVAKKEAAAAEKVAKSKAKKSTRSKGASKVK